MTMPNFIDKTIWGGNGDVSVKEAGRADRKAESRSGAGLPQPGEGDLLEVQRHLRAGGKGTG